MFHPILLTGIALVGLPILLHLIMKQEPKKLSFPAFRFLKQKQFSNQRKLRLKHLILMALRMGLILLTCLALFQPSCVKKGFGSLTDQPVAIIIVMDTSPSMGYVISEQRSSLNEARKQGIQLLEESLEGNWTFLDDARYRALEILAKFPSSSKVAIIETSDRDEPVWSLNVAEAKKRIQNLKRTKANSAPVTRALEKAYNLFAKLEQEANLPEERLPRLLCVLSDRTLPSWDQSRIEDLKKFRDRASLVEGTEEKIEISSIYLDVGLDKTAPNLAISAIEMRPQLISPLQPAVINVAIDANVKEGANILSAKIERVAQPRDFSETLQKPVKLNPDGKANLEFRWDDLKPGLYQVEFKLETPDALPFDNVRHWTFRVREPKRILTLVDLPLDLGVVTGGLGLQGKGQANAGYWQRALRVKGWYSAEIHGVSEVSDWKPADWSKYEAVALAGVDHPSEELWKAIFEYVQAGGRLMIFPSPTLNPVEYETPIAKKLLPAKFLKFVEIPDTQEGTRWAWNAINYSHPLLEPFGKWRDLPNIDFFRNPPMTWRYWEVEPTNKQSPIVPYADAPDADQRHAALLELNVNQGKVILFTTDWSLRTEPRSHNYASTSFYLVLSHFVASYLIGDVEDRTFNHTNGQNVLIKWPADADPNKPYYLSGPDVIGTDAILKRTAQQEFLLLGPEKLISAGNFTVANEDQSWLEGFSLNPPSEESNLDRVPVEQVEDLLGKESVAPAQKDLQLSEVLKGKFSSPLELFPFLMILLLLFLAFENWLSNRFYQDKS